MLSSRSLSRFTHSERLALQRQWLRIGQCLRCFHTSISRRAENENGSQGTPQKAPRRGPTRQQRAAMISEEVKMIQRDHPAPTFSEPDPDTLRPPGAGQTIDPQVLGEDGRPGRMGANDTSTQEGPTAQGVGRLVDASEDVVADTTKMARGARSPHDTVTEPTEGGPGVLNVSTRSKQSTTVQTPSPPPKSTVAQFRADVASGKFSISTIAGNRFENLIADNVGQVRRRVGHRKATRKSKQQTPTSVLRATVAGQHEPMNSVTGTTLNQRLMNEIAKATTMNGTYMFKDREAFLRKMRTLLPEPNSAGTPRKQANNRKDA